MHWKMFLSIINNFQQHWNVIIIKWFISWKKIRRDPWKNLKVEVSGHSKCHFGQITINIIWFHPLKDSKIFLWSTGFWCKFCSECHFFICFKINFHCFKLFILTFLLFFTNNQSTKLVKWLRVLELGFKIFLASKHGSNRVS